MNQSPRSNKRLLLVTGGTVLLSIALIIFLITEHKKSTDYTTKITDPDTGEVVYEQPNQAPEKTAGIIVFGAYLLSDNGATQAQSQKIQQALSDYSKQNLHNQYKTLTIIPSTLKAQSGSMAGQLRLGETSNTVDLSIKIWDLQYVEVKISDKSGANGGNYDSGTLNAPTNTTQSG